MAQKDPKIIKNIKSSGIHIEELELQRRSFKNNAKKCLTNALIIAFVVIAQVGFFGSAFALPFNRPLVFGAISLYSLYFAFLFLNSFNYYVGYISLPIIVALGSFATYRIVNSGFSAMLNMISESVDAEMNLPFLHQYNEFYPNRYISITGSLCVVCVILCCFVNMWVSRRKSAVFIIACDVVIVEFCIYLNNDFSYGYLFMMMASVIMYVLSKLNDSGEFFFKKRYRAYHISKKTVIIDNSKTNTGINLVLSLASAFIVFMLGILFSIGMSDLFFDRQSKLKDSTDKVVANVASYGLSYYFSANNAGDGGIDNGKVGSIGTVIMDGQTDIVLDYVPYSTERMYLPHYVANVYDYEKRQWVQSMTTADTYFGNISKSLATMINEEYPYSDYTYSEADFIEHFYPGDYIGNNDYDLNYNILKSIHENGMSEPYDYASGHLTSKAQDRMTDNDKTAKTSFRIKNVDLNAYSLGSYYSTPEAGNTTLLRGEDLIVSDAYVSDYTFKELKYLRHFTGDYSDREDETGMDYTMIYDMAVLMANTQLPNEMYSTIHRLTEENGFDRVDFVEDWVFYDTGYRLPKGFFDYDDFSDFSRDFNEFKMVDQEIKIVEELQDYFRENFTYTLSPGVPAWNIDPILYFLNDKKEGYCVYFASSAVLMLRDLGVPARYVEGYAVDFADLEDVMLVDDLYGEDGMKYEGEGEYTSTYGSYDKSESVFDGYNALGLDNSRIFEVELTDQSAHAWVEVYFYGYGWVPVEFTLATEGDDTGSILQGLLSTSRYFNGDALNDVSDNVVDTKAAAKATRRAFSSIAVIFVIVVACVYAFKYFRRKYMLYHSKPEKRVVYQYRNLSRAAKSVLLYDNRGSHDEMSEVERIIFSHEKLSDVLNDKNAADKNLIDDYMSNVLEYNYSCDENLKNDTERVAKITDDYKQLIKGITRKLPWYKRLLQY